MIEFKKVDYSDVLKLYKNIFLSIMVLDFIRDTYEWRFLKLI